MINTLSLVSIKLGASPKKRPKGYAFIIVRMDIGREIFLSIWNSNIQVKVLFLVKYMFSENPLEFLVCAFGTSTCLQLDCKGSRKPKTKERKNRP
jgi:hypothetical protein